MREGDFYELYNFMGDTWRIARTIINFEPENLEFVVSPMVFDEIKKRVHDPIGSAGKYDSLYRADGTLQYYFAGVRIIRDDTLFISGYLPITIKRISQQ